ncbi:histone deacetylase, putative [Plasmodium malariae]|uniref:Histone deacetylase, putative n=1 Tax=Plasmodium malariae TaxID=5858 RepID=A0A1A8W4A4_PLAMA|nr:histone deacetylase, putative [Plasmodium malariae]
MGRKFSTFRNSFTLLKYFTAPPNPLHGSQSYCRLLDVQGEINEKIEKCFKEKKYENIFCNQKKFSACSKNPPYVFHPIYSDVELKQNHRFKIKKYEPVFTQLSGLFEFNGTILSALLALKYCMCMHICGGNHHSKKNGGDGFCLFNDIAVGIEFLLSEKIIDKVIILDVDVYQGDGTAEIFENWTNVKIIILA